MHIDIISAARTISAEASKVVAPSVDGELGILPNHAPMIARLKSGMVKITTLEGHEENYQISGGVVEVQPHLITVLADNAQAV